MAKKYILLLGITLFCMSFIQKNEYRSVHDTGAFSRGEKLTYLAHYGFINAGRATVKMDKNIYYRQGRPCYKVDVDGWTVGMFAWGVKVKDKWRSYIDTSAVIPHEFYRNISENKYKLTETTYFNQKAKKARVKQTKKGKKSEKLFTVPQYAQDLVSGYYYLRTLDFSSMKKGDKVTVKGFFEDESFDLEVEFLGRETVKTKVGKIKAFKMRPIMPDNEMFDGEDAIEFWVSDDENKVPVKIKAGLFVGAVEVELTSYSGLKAEFNWDK
ncbi:MAG: hypothetical protein ACJAWV_000142 [Flammeovirgaceae bacterium]|jgi:hypothetical protein